MKRARFGLWFGDRPPRWSLIAAFCRPLYSQAPSRSALKHSTTLLCQRGNREYGSDYNAKVDNLYLATMLLNLGESSHGMHDVLSRLIELQRQAEESGEQFFDLEEAECNVSEEDKEILLGYIKRK